MRDMRGKGKAGSFLFLEEDRRAFVCPPGGSKGKGATIAALGYRRRREKRRAQLWHGTGNPACGGLWPFQLIQLIYLRYLCGSAEREERMDVCFLLTLYI